MLSRKMSIEEKILRVLFDRKFLNKIAAQTFLQGKLFAQYHPQSVRNTISKLTKNGLIRTGAEGIMIQAKGRAFIEKKLERLHYFNSPFRKNVLKNLLVLFDIPEDRKAEREWFRKQLREFGYEMIQKSVWLGPSPLPEEFVIYVKAIGLKGCIKTFRLAPDQQQTLKAK